MESNYQQNEEVRGIEARRLDALKRYGVLDNPQEEIFDRITAAACAVCEVPFSAISLVDSNRLWFLSEIGIDATELVRDKSFCSYVTDHPEAIFEVADTAKDERFKDNPLLTGNLNIRFYAASPLRTPEGYVLGTLAVLSDQPGTLSLSLIHI